MSYEIGAAARSLMQREPTSLRNLPLGFDSISTVAAAGSATVSSQPQVVFRADRLVVPASIAGYFLINDIKIGKNSQLISSTAIPAQAFQQDGTGVGLKMDTAQVSQLISISVTNVDVAAHRFIAAMLGPAVE